MLERAKAETMSRLTWSAFIDLHPEAHLLIAVVTEDEPAGCRGHLNLMARLAARLSKGHHAVTINRRNSGPEVHCAFEQEGDAKRIGDALGAKDDGVPPGWATRRRFRMDPSVVESISEALRMV